MIKIENIGVVLKTNNSGYLESKAHKDKIPNQWKPVLDDVVKVYVKHLGDSIHSIYVRGSIANGTAINSLSDVDTIAVLNSEIPQDKLWVKDENSNLKLKYDFITRVEFVFVEFSKIIDSNEEIKKQFILKTQSVCVFGDDLIPSLPDFKPTKEITCVMGHDFSTQLEKTRVLIESLEDEKRLERECKYLMKDLIRTGFSLVIEKEQAYTRDLYPAYELFAKHFPEKEKQMFEALNLALNPTSDKEILLKITGQLGTWIATEVDRMCSETEI